MKIAGCQLNIVWENKSANFAKVRALLEAARLPPGSLIVLPEMFATGFSMNVTGITADGSSATEEFLSSIARQYQSAVVAGMATASPNGRGRNEAVVFGPSGEPIARYCKIHPFTFGGEAQHYEAGTDLVLFDWGGFKMAPFVCYDLRFPEVFRAAVRRGAQLFLVIANWPAKRLQHWITLLQARAIENQAYVCGINRCGQDPKLVYPGRSLLVDPQGEILTDGGDQEGVITAEIDPARVIAWRQEFPALPDIRAKFVTDA